MRRPRFIKALLASLALTATLCTDAQAPKREMRSAWVAGMGIDWPMTRGTTAAAQTAAKNEMIAYLDKLKAQNFTGICLHVRPRGDAYYKSTLEPWSSDISGTRGTNPGWDPLAFAIEECHKRGMECYAWINPFRINTSTTEYTTSFDKQWKADGIIFKNDTWTVFNPGLPAARKHCLDVMTEIYSNYDVDGMLFDDYFYPGDKMPKTVDASADGALYKASGTSLSLADWRRNNVNTFVKELYDRIQAVRPDMRFGIGPAGVGGASAAKYGLSKPAVKSSDWMYDDIYCDPLAWMADKSVDFIAPQIYWATTNSSAPFEPLAKWWSDAAAHFGIHNYVSIASYKVNTAEYGGTVAAGSKEIGKEVEICRSTTKNNASGQLYYNTKSINGPGITGLGDYLGANQYSRPALVPVVSWKTPVKYDAPADVKYASGKLSWTAAKRNGRAIIRYTVYAVPESKTMAEAKAADGDGIDAQYLLDVSYANSYSIPAAKQKGYWYAVCVYDGYGNEFEPGTFNLEKHDTDRTEPGYEVKKDPTVYYNQGNLKLESLWVRSAHAPYNNHVFVSDGALNRGMVATQTHVYVCGRSENSATADIFLEEFNGFTGEHIRRITLSEKGKVKFYPCNDVVKDTKGNILISNLSTNLSTLPVHLFKVNTENGDLTEVAQLTYSAGGRCDHVGVYGDVDSGTFTVFAAVASSGTLLRWKVVNGVVGAAEAKTITAFYPTTASHFGIAPKVRPITGNQVYVDGSTTAMTLYNFNKGTIIGSFANVRTRDSAPTNTEDNGNALFTIGADKFAVYSTQPGNANLNYSADYKIAHAGTSTDYSTLSHLWTVPEEGLGGVRSTTCSAPVDAVTTGPNSAQVYVYSPGNGIAAYRVTNTSITAVEDLDAPVTLPAYHLDGLNVIFEQPVAATAYSPSGQAVAQTGTGVLHLPASGIYILHTPSGATRIYVR